MTASGRIIAAVADWEGVNHPSKINGLQWLTSDFGTTVL